MQTYLRRRGMVNGHECAFILYTVQATEISELRRPNHPTLICFKDNVMPS